MLRMTNGREKKVLDKTWLTMSSANPQHRHEYQVSCFQKI
jgi:hypothetical protein